MIHNPCDMPYKLPRRRTFEVMTGCLFDGMKIRKMYFERVKANNAFDAFAVADKAVLWWGEPNVREVSP